MSEPPHGHNYGRKRSMEGTWVSLETDDVQREGGLVEVRKHGTRYTAQKIGCACELCREWKREHSRKARAHDVTTPNSRGGV